MGEVYLKEASGSAAASGSTTSGIVATMLADLESGGEAESRAIARKLDGW